MKLNWGFGIAFVYSLFAVSMVVFAIVVSQHKNDLVTDNYYEDAIKYQERIDAGNNASRAEYKFIINYQPESQTLEISSQGKLNHINGSVSFYKPDKASIDFKVKFLTDERGMQIIPLENIAHGYWKVGVSWMYDDTAFYIEERIFIK